MSEPALLCEVPIPVRWRDLDAFNHVNNATFLTYLEEARLHWFGTVPGPWFTEQSAPVVAAATANYRRQLGWPAQLVVALYCERIGNSSLTIGFRIVDATDRAIVYADGQTVLVWIDTTSGKSMPLPDAIRAACGAK
ncbi:MAG TPA: thioesterase family protein [Rudaea sp.]